MSGLRARRAAGAVLVLLLLSGCVTPATGRGSYRDKAVTSVRAATSEISTAELTVRLLQRGRAFASYADETITSNETALGSIAAAFGSVQPPDGEDTVRDDVSSLLGDAQDAVAAARIAARRSDASGLAQASADLRKVAADLSTAEKRLS